MEDVPKEGSLWIFTNCILLLTLLVHVWARVIACNPNTTRFHGAHKPRNPWAIHNSRKIYGSSKLKSKKKFNFYFWIYTRFRSFVLEDSQEGIVEIKDDESGWLGLIIELGHGFMQQSVVQIHVRIVWCVATLEWSKASVAREASERLQWSHSYLLHSQLVDTSQVYLSLINNLLYESRELLQDTIFPYVLHVLHLWFLTKLEYYVFEFKNIDI